jgi:hypothetical protein
MEVIDGDGLIADKSGHVNKRRATRALLWCRPVSDARRRRPSQEAADAAVPCQACELGISGGGHPWWLGSGSETSDGAW